MNKVIYAIIGWSGNIVGFALLFFDYINNQATLFPLIPFGIALIYFYISLKKNDYV